MTHAQTILSVSAPRQGLHDVTLEIGDWVRSQSVTTGLLTVFIRHTSASLLIQENVEPDVQHDLNAFFDRTVPEDVSLYTHNEEGPDDMPAHIKGALTASNLAVPVSEGRLLLGQYQGVFLFEHRRRPRVRELVLHLMGTGE